MGPLGIDESEDWTPAQAPEPGQGPFANAPIVEAQPEDLLEEDLELPAEEPEPPASQDTSQPEGQQQPEQTPAPADQEDPLARYVGEGRKFADEAALARGYESAEQLIGRQGQRVAAAEAQIAELRGMLERAARLMQVQQQPPAAPAPLDPRLVAAAEQAGLDENALRVAQVLAAQEADRRTSALAQQMAVQQAQQAQQAQQLAAHQSAQTEAFAFRDAHADELASDPALVARIDAAFEALDVWEDDPLPQTRRSFEIAYEAAKDPALMKVLQNLPDLIDTDDGMELARRLAQAEKPGTPPASGSTTPAPTPPAVHVESGGSGLRPDGAGQTEEWETLRLAKAQAKTSPLGI